MKRKLLIVVLAASLALIGSLVAERNVRSRFGAAVPQARVLDDGFAVWPADTLAEAKAECPSAFVPSWRHSAESTVARYSQEMLGIDNPRRISRSRVASPDIFVDIYAKGVPLYHFATVRRSGPCWYVTGAANRESFCCMGSIGYAGRGTDRKLFLHVKAAGNWARDARVVGQIGFGERINRFSMLLSDEQPVPQITLPAQPDSKDTGHYHLAVVDDPDGAADIPEGRPVGAPPGPGTGLRAPHPVDAKRAVLEAARARSRCDDSAFWAGSRPRSVVRQTLDTAVQENPLGKEAYNPRENRVRSNGDWVVSADDAKVLFDFWRIRGHCEMLGRIQPLAGREGVRAIRVIDDAFSFDLDWGRATDVWIDFGFFGNTGSGAVSPIDNPIVFDSGGSFSTDRPGFYEAYFFEGGRLVSIQSAALPPLKKF